MKEARLLAGLGEHPYLVRIHDLDFHQDRPFLVMEYVRGVNLYQQAKQQQYPPRDAAVLVAKLARGLAAPHRIGVTHRDLKPSNVLIDPQGPNLSTRRVTISTAGIVPRIYDLGRDLPTQLAVSLNATTDEVRDRIMPINKKWPLAVLLEALRAYPLPPRRRLTIEYVLLGDVNDSLDDARRLVRLLDGIPVKVNLLPLNPHDRTELVPPSPARASISA